MGYPITGGSFGTWMEEIRASRGVNPATHLEAGCRLTKSAAQSIPNNTWTPVTWDEETYDTDELHDLAVNPSRVTIQRAGVYLVVASGVFATSNTGRRLYAIAVNGTREVRQAAADVANDGNGFAVVTLPPRRFDAGDYVELHVLQTSGGALDLVPSVAGEGVTTLSVQYLGPSS